MSTYVILGAGGGIGTALCHELAANGAQLMLGGRDEGKLSQLANDLNADDRVMLQTIDATQIDAVEQFVKAAKQQFGQVDGIVNLVGSILLKPAHRISDEEWFDTINTNLTSSFAVVKAAAKTMRKNGGTVVLMSSGIARAGFANHEAIAAAKAGVIGLMLSAAATYASSQIRVNAVAPGLVRTPLSEPVLSDELSHKASVQMHALNEVGEPEHVASMISWLLDPRNDWVTGQVFGVDGGLGTVRPRLRI